MLTILKKKLFSLLLYVARMKRMQKKFHAVLSQVGIRNIEITFSTPNAVQVISDLSEEFADCEDVVIGAGTVMTPELAHKAIAAGAQFLVSPYFSQDIATIANQEGNLYFPGCATATEIVTAMKAGCPIIKVFPGGVVGPSFIKDIQALFLK